MKRFLFRIRILNGRSVGSIRWVSDCASDNRKQKDFNRRRKTPMRTSESLLTDWPWVVLVFDMCVATTINNMLGAMRVSWSFLLYFLSTFWFLVVVERGQRESTVKCAQTYDESKNECASKPRIVLIDSKKNEKQQKRDSLLEQAHAYLIWRTKMKWVDDDRLLWLHRLRSTNFVSCVCISTGRRMTTTANTKSESRSRIFIGFRSIDKEWKEPGSCWFCHIFFSLCVLSVFVVSHFSFSKNNTNQTSTKKTEKKIGLLFVQFVVRLGNEKLQWLSPQSLSQLQCTAACCCCRSSRFVNWIQLTQKCRYERESRVCAGAKEREMAFNVLATGDFISGCQSKHEQFFFFLISFVSLRLFNRKCRWNFTSSGFCVCSTSMVKCGERTRCQENEKKLKSDQRKWNWMSKSEESKEKYRRLSSNNRVGSNTIFFSTFRCYLFAHTTNWLS